MFLKKYYQYHIADSVNLGVGDNVLNKTRDDYYDNIDKVRGLNVTICTTAKNNEDGLELLRNFNMPFKSKETN